MQHVLITGICGFTGRYLAAHLTSLGIRCTGMSNGCRDIGHPLSLEGVRIHDVDITHRHAVRDLVASEKPDHIFHLAAMSHVADSRKQPEQTFEVNVIGTFNLLESVRQYSCPVRVLFVSSGNVYGNTDSGEYGFIETDPTSATSPYASSKLIGEELARSYFRDFGLEIIIARPFNHTGPGQPPAFVCSEFARAIAGGIVASSPICMKTGRLEPRRDFTDVRDVVRAYAALAVGGRPGEVYNVCSGSMISMDQIVAMLAEMSPVRVTTQFDPSKARAHEIMRSGGNYGKIRRELEWKPQIPITETLRNLLNYWVDKFRTGDVTIEESDETSSERR